MRYAIVFGILACSIARAQSASDRFFKETFDQMLRDNPEFATSTGHHEYDDRLTDWSKAGRDRRKQFFSQKLKELDALRPSGPADELTKRIVKFDFESRLEAWDLDTRLLRVAQMDGFHNLFYNTIDRMPTRTVRDYDNVISRLRAVPAYIDQHIALMDEAIASGVMQPRLVANLVIAQLDAQIGQTAAETALLKGFRDFPQTIPGSERARLIKEGMDAYNNSFLPAWRKARAYMAGTYLQHVRRTDSLSSIPDGRGAYSVLIHRLTTTTMSAAEIHKFGLDEVERIEAAMARILREAAFNGTVSEYQKKLDADPAMHFRSKDEMLANSRNIAKTIEPELPNQFRHIPALLFGVRPIPPDREAATATNAQGATPDLSSPGWFNLNTYEPERQVRYDQESLVLHEAIPGHIFQGALASQLNGVPEIRKFYTNSAFGEGWALYAESLGARLGVYKTPEARFGQLASENFRAVRLVVDTGIHDLGWTREQAVEYFKQHSPQTSVAEVDRYISWPAQALSYKLGELRIRSLRDQAEKELGPKFDIRDYNDAVIRDGRLPLDVLTDQIGRFIFAAKATH